MPLDVQPLSPVRRALMVLLMFALLGAALGFAQLLVQRQHARDDARVAVIVGFNQPLGAAKPLEINDDLQDALSGPLSECFVDTDAGQRRYVAFSLVDSDDGYSATDFLSLLFARTTGDSDTLPAPTKTTLGGQPAIQVEKTYIPVTGTAIEASSTFAIMRLAMVGEHIVAICFSGKGPLAESDRQSFAAYCDHGVHITLVRAGQNSRRN